MSIREVAKQICPPLVWDALRKATGRRDAPIVAPIDYQGVITPHNMAGLHSGRFAELHEKYAAMDKSISSNTTRLRTYFICLFASIAKRSEGDFLTAGISYGVAPHVMYDFIDFPSLGKKFHMVDPFTGISETGAILDKYNRDAHFVRSQYPADAPLVMHKAMIPDDLPIEVGPLAFVHLNTTSYVPEAKSLPFFMGKLSDHGIMVIDGYALAPGHQHTFDPALRALGVEAFTLPTGQGVVINTSH